MGASPDLRELRRVSVADQVVGVLRQRILTGELRPGTPLLEIPLASSLRVSRNTMREAMKVLSLEGLLTRSVYRGIAVAELTPQDIREIYHLRRMLELSAVQAGKSPGREHLEKLRRLLDQYETAVRAGDWTSAVASDLQFHSLLIRFHNNRRLEAFYQKVLRELRMGMVLADRGLDNPTRLIRVHAGFTNSWRLENCGSAPPPWRSTWTSRKVGSAKSSRIMRPCRTVSPGNCLRLYERQSEHGPYTKKSNSDE